MESCREQFKRTFLVHAVPLFPFKNYLVIERQKQDIFIEQLKRNCLFLNPPCRSTIFAQHFNNRLLCRKWNGKFIILFYLQVKAKKLQKEEERSYEILSNNLILLRHLTEIASSKRVSDDNRQKEKQPHLYEQILLFRRSQLRKMIDEENEQLDEKEDQLRFFVNSEERELKKKQKQNKASKK